MWAEGFAFCAAKAAADNGTPDDAEGVPYAFASRYCSAGALFLGI